MHKIFLFKFFSNQALNTLENFRWHDLRHTWASWHVQYGTSLQELQQLGGWTSFEMVLRYAHLSSDHLRSAAERVGVTNWLQSGKEDFKETTVTTWLI